MSRCSPLRREKLGGTYPINANLGRLLDNIVADNRWDVTYLGMQIMVEGLAGLRVHACDDDRAAAQGSAPLRHERRGAPRGVRCPVAPGVYKDSTARRSASGSSSRTKPQCN